MKRYIVLLFLCFLCPLLYAQTTVTKYYTTEDGLIANDVRALLLDSKGILWIGSRAGLSVRQQGKITTDEVALEHRFTNITAIVEDQQQGIWIGSYGQGILYKGPKHTRLFNEKQGLNATRINALFVTATHLYIGSSEGIARINLQSLVVEASPTKNTLETPSPVSSFYQIGTTIFATTINHGVFKVEGNQLIPVSEAKEIMASYYNPKWETLFLGLKFNLEILQSSANQRKVAHRIKGVRFFSSCRR